MQGKSRFEGRMQFSEKEMLEDLRKVRIRQYTLFFGGLGVLGLTVTLFVIFAVRHDLAALMLAGVGLFWTTVLGYQAFRTSRLSVMISERIDGEGAGGGGAERPGEPGAREKAGASGPEQHAPGPAHRGAGGEAGPEGGGGAP